VSLMSRCLSVDGTVNDRLNMASADHDTAMAV
jgi:hypothetical protein